MYIIINIHTTYIYMVQDAEFRGEVYQSKDDTKIARALGKEYSGAWSPWLSAWARIYTIYMIHTSVMYMDGYNVCIV